MGRVKIYLGKNETAEQAEELLHKALSSQRNGDAHSDDFQDPVVRDVVDIAADAHEKMYQEMLREIADELDKEYSVGD